MDELTTHTQGPWPPEQRDLLQDASAAIDRLHFECSMAGSAVRSADPCGCPAEPGLVTHLSSQEEQERYHLAELRAAVEKADRVLLGVRPCGGCGQTTLLLASRPDLLMPLGWSHLLR